MKNKYYLIVFALFVTACNGPAFLLKERGRPAHQIIDSKAAAFGMHRSIVDTGRFSHVLYESDVQPWNRPATTEKLHVYIEGDGVAWRNRFVISDDPTSKNVLMLELMATDKARSVYVGRPCYLGRSADPGCDYVFWSYQRFSNDVVDSMVAAIRESAGDAIEIVLFGHSGGGALAILIAARLPQVTAVVTVAGNLDTGAWARHHGYTPLFGSLNPALQPPLPDGIRQLHLLGERDGVTPPKLMQHWIDSQPATSVWRFASYTHNCCWRQQWSRVLDWVNTGASAVIPASSRRLPTVSASENLTTKRLVGRGRSDPDQDALSSR